MRRLLLLLLLLLVIRLVRLPTITAAAATATTTTTIPMHCASVPTIRIKARRRTPKRPTSLAQPRRRPGPCIRHPIGICAAQTGRPGRGGLAVDVIVTVVARALRGVGQHLVGGGYGGEFRVGGGIFWVFVRVVREGERVESSAGAIIVDTLSLADAFLNGHATRVWGLGLLQRNEKGVD